MANFRGLEILIKKEKKTVYIYQVIYKGQIKPIHHFVVTT